MEGEVDGVYVLIRPLVTSTIQPVDGSVTLWTLHLLFNM